MNILIPDRWLRKFLITKATPEQLKKCLSLCGPSIERIHMVNNDSVYDVEITTNRPDAMSVLGVAREASVILPRFDIKAELINDPYKIDTKLEKKHVRPTEIKPIHIETDSLLNPRWTSIVLDNVYATDSPKWLQDLLDKAGVRPINTIVDVTNYLMIGFGQPCHAFDYDRIGKKNGTPWMKLRASKKGEKLKTLDGKSHTLWGDDIVIEDGTGKIMDLCGIMGGESSSITKDTKTIVLFIQTYEPVHIRKTMMKLSHRTDAGSLFEKGIDSELVLPALLLGIELLQEVAGGKIASIITDIYPKPYKPNMVSCTRTKLNTYLGTSLETKQIKDILVSLGLMPTIKDSTIEVIVPSFRRDIEIDVDIIEEIARIYGYHNIPSTLPNTAPPLVIPDPQFYWEQEIKIRLRDWGFTETYTYSMISEQLMDTFALDKSKAYKISNPYSNDWVYMRPTLVPSVISVLKQKMHNKASLELFELSMIYEYREQNLPLERPVLCVGWTGLKFLEAKGLAEAIFKLFGIPFPEALGEYGFVNEIQDQSITILYLYLDIFVKNASLKRVFTPISKYPSVMEDLAFLVPEKFAIGPLMTAFQKAHTLVESVTLLDAHEHTRTLHIVYQNKEKNLTSEDVLPVREKLIKLAEQSFGVTLKTAA